MSQLVEAQIQIEPSNSTDFVASLESSEYKEFRTIQDDMESLKHFIHQENGSMSSQISNLRVRCKRQEKLIDQLVRSFVKIVECVNKLQNNHKKLTLNNQVRVLSNTRKHSREAIPSRGRSPSIHSLHSRSRSSSSSDLSLYQTYRNYINSPIARHLKHNFRDIMRYARVNRHNIVTLLIILAALTIIYSLLFRGY